MQFTSIPFFIFLFAVVVAYYALPQKYRNYLLLAASYYFYFSIQPEYLVLLMISTLVNYLLGRGLEVYLRRKKVLLCVGLLFNLGILFFFKYFNFFGDQVNVIFSSLSMNISIPHHSLILPIGISFYTFMALGYVLDVYWGDIKSQRNLLTFSIYLAFFPQILCGPIGRAKNLFKQFTEMHPLLYDNFANGFRLILWGLFKKMVVADNIGAYVDAVYNNIPMHSTLTLIVTALLYPLQLYADFGGYTDIARGVGKTLGFDLMVNFRTPYVNSTSVTDYWRRNHISLTSWFREYVFFPFIGTSSSKLRVYIGITLMFIASGIWHGVGWMFIIWGAIQAMYLMIENLLGIGNTKSTSIISSVTKRITTYIFLSIGLVFFRLPTIDSLRSFVTSIHRDFFSFYSGSKSMMFTIATFSLVIISLELIMDRKQFDEFINERASYLRWASYLILGISVIAFGNVESNAFLYTQF